MATRIGVLSDIHGNLTALRAVLADAARQGIDQFWVLGDVLMPGPGGQELLDTLDEAPVTAWVIGNWDQILVEIMGGVGDLSDPTDIYTINLVRHILADIGQAGVERVASWPLHLTRQVSGIVVTASHNLPTKSDGRDLEPTGRQENFNHLFDGNEAGLALIGHTHRQLLRYGPTGQTIINPGSVGQAPMTRPGELTAHYAVVTIDRQEIGGIQFRRIAFDGRAEADLARRRGLPYLDLYLWQLDHAEPVAHDLARLSELSQRYGYGDIAAQFLAERQNAAQAMG